MSLVLDSSAALGWIYPDEDTDAATTIFSLVVASGAWVPALWRIEVANSLQVGIRRGRIDRTFRDAALADLARLDISVDLETSNFAWTNTLQCADRFGLTLYDAVYLELAQRRSLPLASLDHALRDAAGALGMTLVVT
jgi:predicted nucleic acid-binding protein